jgi:hypothetical protein
VDQEQALVLAERREKGGARFFCGVECVVAAPCGASAPAWREQIGRFGEGLPKADL